MAAKRKPKAIDSARFCREYQKKGKLKKSKGRALSPSTAFLDIFFMMRKTAQKPRMIPKRLAIFKPISPSKEYQKAK